MIPQSKTHDSATKTPLIVFLNLKAWCLGSLGSTHESVLMQEWCINDVLMQEWCINDVLMMY